MRRSGRWGFFEGLSLLSGFPPMDIGRMAARVAGSEKRVSISLTAEEAKALIKAVEADHALHAKVKEAVEAVPWQSDRVHGWVPPDQRKK